MYLEYCLIANITICVLSIILFLILKKRNQISRKNIFILILCTALAMICATLIPLIADYLVEELSFSIPESLTVSFFFLAVPALIVFYTLLNVYARRSNNDVEKSEADESVGIVGIIGDHPEDKTDIKETPEMVSDFFKMAETGADNFKTSETVTNNFKTGESDAYIGDDSVSINELETIGEEEKQNITQTEEIDSIPEELNVSEEEVSSEEQKVPEEQKVSENHEYIKPVYTEVPTHDSNNQSVITGLLNLAMDSKMNHHYQTAIAAYERALTLDSDDELSYLLILDLCSLYKITGNPGSIYKLLNSVQCNLLSEDKKEDIITNIKNS